MDMTSPRRGFLPVIASLAVFGALLVSAPQAQAAGETLQVNKEVTTVTGGTPVTLTPRLSKDATSAVPVTFKVISGNASPATQTCTVPVGENTCPAGVTFSSDVKGTALIQAYLNSSPDDPTEGRLSNNDPPPLLPPG